MATQPDMRGGVSQWQDKVSAAYFPLIADTKDRIQFRGDLDIWPLGSVSATRITCDGVLYRRDAKHLKDERESSLLISIPGRAEVTFSQNGRQACCRPGGFVIERSDAPYEYLHDTADVQWVVKFPRDSIRARIGSAEQFLGLCLDGRTGMTSYFLSSLRAAIEHSAQLNSKGRELVGEHLTELLCLALREDDRALDSADTVVQRAHLTRAEQYIRSHLKDHDLSPSMVAENCGISVRYLQRLFAFADMSVASYIRECRLVHCDEDLRSRRQDETIATIAYRWGFSDQAQFSRLYRAKYGVTPREARKAFA